MHRDSATEPSLHRRDPGLPGGAVPSLDLRLERLQPVVAVRLEVAVGQHERGVQRRAELVVRARRVAPRVISDCHFRKTATEYDRKPGIKWLRCTAK